TGVQLEQGSVVMQRLVIADFAAAGARGPAADIGDDSPGGTGAAVPEARRVGVGNGEDHLALAHLAGVPDGNRLESNFVVNELEDGQVAPGVGGVNVGIAPLAAGEANVNLGSAPDYMVVGQDLPLVFIDHHAAPERFGHGGGVGKIQPDGA